MTRTAPRHIQRFPSPASARPVLLLLVFLLLGSCSGGDGRRETDPGPEHGVYGFFLGETREELFERAEGIVGWRKIPAAGRDSRGDTWRLSGTLDGARGIDRVRISFLDGKLMEVVVYFRQTQVYKLESLRRELEKRYGKPAYSPDGTIETVYKTYRISGPGMSITLRRITKKPAAEFYVQFLHEGLHRRFLDSRAGGG